MKKIILSLFFISIFGMGHAQLIEIELLKDGFSNPLNLQHAGDDRLFVVEQTGLIKILQTNGTVNPTPFLDVSGLISTGSERGLLGLAFHPDYSNNGYFYINYTNTSGNTQVSRFSVDSGDPDIANLGSELPIISYTQPRPNHNGGCLAFGPDGYLYISSGDGGPGGDPDNRAQDTNVLLGKLLRIDIDNPAGGNNYGIPPDNPFVGNPNAKEEIWAYGLRNPWRFSFDFTDNDLWIGDVGQGDVEEINKVSATEAGLNYGWRCYEGSEPFNLTGCPPSNELTFPIAEYDSNGGNCSVTGGYVYRGTTYPLLEGLYFYSDYCSGLIATIDESGNVIDHGTFGGGMASFGEDVNKELYIINISQGAVYRIFDSELSTPNNNCEYTVSMHPNPASNKISFKIEDKLQNITIVDIKGSVVHSEKNLATSNKDISVENLEAGIYFVKISSEKGKSLIKKLIIQ